MAQQKKSSPLPQPLRAAGTVLQKVPGAGVVGRAAGGALDAVGSVSPRGRRMVVYTGAGVLGVAGVVEWPIALTGAAVAWLTQPRPKAPAVPESSENAEGSEGGMSAEQSAARDKTSAEWSKTSLRQRKASTSQSRASTGHGGPTARRGRTTI
ncbi:hypothetical protein AB0D27_16750 [Streptomyces sp. NPDC048415]|jgi:hypothetical protein|uniref:hypothetical protein n=1 Tax=Streptomyces sp. NPDC048415 TaxID=3154822 RepID=UPI0034239E4A